MDMAFVGTPTNKEDFLKLIEKSGLPIELDFFEASKIYLPITQVKRYDLTVIYYDNSYAQKDWFIFLFGYFTAKGSGLLLFNSSDPIMLPRWIEQSKIFIDDDKIFLMRLKSFYQSFQISSQQLSARRELLNKGYLVNIYEFCEVLQQEEFEDIKLFLTAGFSPSSDTRKGVSMLAHCLRKGAISSFYFLLREGADIYAVSKDRNFSILMEATAISSLDVVKLAISLGVGLDQVSKEGQSALILAAAAGNIQICSALIEAGADKSIVDAMGMSALDYANLFSATEIVKLLQN